MTDKETQGKLDLLAALLAGGVENLEGYDLALEEYRKNLAREEKTGWDQFEFQQAEPDNLEFIMEMEKRGYKYTGSNFNKFQRKELQGMPRFAELCGPMFDGDAIRYEGKTAYQALSA